MSTSGGAKTRTVLLVDDEPVIRMYIHAVLELKGYAVLEANDADEAISLAQTHPNGIDALVTDLMLCGMGGRELACNLLQMRPELKVIYISGFADPVGFELAVQDPKAAFLQKPFTPDALVLLLGKLLRSA